MSLYGEPVHSLTVNGTNLYDYCKLYVSGSGTFDSVERDYDRIEVPGRSGDLILSNNRFKNRDVTYTAFIIDDFNQNVSKLRNFLTALPVDYVRIEDTYHPEEYVMGIHKGPLNLSVHPRMTAGSFNLSFNLKPFRYLKSGDTKQSFTSGSTILNETSCDAKPLIRVYGNGTIVVGDVTVQIAGITQYVDLDCETQNATEGNDSRNSSVSITGYEYPVLKPGGNKILIGAGVTKVEITPRWCIV